MSEQTVNQTVVVCNSQGLHFRPAHLFVTLAKQFESKVEVIKDGSRVDGKSILDITALGAARGAQLSIEATGEDAEAALQALVQLVEVQLVEEDQEDQEDGQGQPMGENVPSS